MDHDFVLVEYLSNINAVVKKTFQSMQRIRLVCFDVSPNFLIFGATSGGIYIFKREPCTFLKLIPSKEGAANLLAISKDEQHLGMATSRGLLLIAENFIQDTNVQYQVFSEHEGKQITYMKWHRNELYVGDNKGKISVVSVSFPTKSIFQIPITSLMTLDSPIVQIDAFHCYLLISTRSKTYLCNTEKENYIQIGKKLRDGLFGACFCNTPNDLGEVTVDQNARNTFHSINDNEMMVLNNSDILTKIYCARPGARIWEVGFDAKVMVTYQFKRTLTDRATDPLVIDCEEESVLTRRINTQEETIPDDFNFQKIYSVCDKFILSYDLKRIYIFDPTSSKLLFWTYVSDKIKNVALFSNNLFIWKETLDISILSVIELEQLILSTLYRRQYYLCAELCIEFDDKLLKLLEHSKKLYLVSTLKGKVKHEKLLSKLQPILDKVKETNEKIFTRQQKGSIVTVENLYVGSKVVQPQRAVIDDPSKELKIILKQYKLNKVHRNIDIPEVTHLLESLNYDRLFVTIKQFIKYIETELNEDAREWCQNVYLKQISKRNIAIEQLDSESSNFVIEAVIKANESATSSCSCGYPLPKSHKNPPNFLKTALAIMNNKNNMERVLKSIPYLWRYRVKTEVYGLNMTALIQYSDLELFKEHSVRLSYDDWHDILGYFTKINKGLCLNCNKTIDINSLMTWTELAKVTVLSLGAKNTIRILEKYEKVIPNGALDPTFYQTCIFANSFNNNDNNSSKFKTDDAFKLLQSLDKPAYEKFQDTLAKYFKRKYAISKNPCYTFSFDTDGTCLICNMPLKNDIFFESETVITCGHRFHKFCFNRNDRSCNICSQNL